jgi:hypothetical protein
MSSKPRRVGWERVIHWILVSGFVAFVACVGFVFLVGLSLYLDQKKTEHKRAQTERATRMAGAAYQAALRDALGRGPVDIRTMGAGGVSASASYGNRSSVHVIVKSVQTYTGGNWFGLSTEVETCFDNVVDVTAKPPIVTMTETTCGNAYRELQVPILRPSG